MQASTLQCGAVLQDITSVDLAQEMVRLRAIGRMNVAIANKGIAHILHREGLIDEYTLKCEEGVGRLTPETEEYVKKATRLQCDGYSVRIEKYIRTGNGEMQPVIKFGDMLRSTDGKCPNPECSGTRDKLEYLMGEGDHEVMYCKDCRRPFERTAPAED